MCRAGKVVRVDTANPFPDAPSVREWFTLIGCLSGMKGWSLKSAGRFTLASRSALVCAFGGAGPLLAAPGAAVVVAQGGRPDP
jgi:hypothetical protein